MPKNEKNYGQELVLDIHDCDFKRCSEEMLTKYFKALCELIEMIRGPLYFWGYDDPKEYAEAPPHLKGRSAIQFIQTSNITVHALEDLKAVYINVFSCKPFDTNIVEEFSCCFFRGKMTHNSYNLDRI